MVVTYLDIETFSKDGPSFNDKIILIALYNSSSRELLLFKEWESSEKEILKCFYDKLEEYLNQYRYFIIVGFNIFRFDIPMLTFRAIKHNVRTLNEILELWRRCYTMDIRQICLLFNNLRFRNLRLENMPVILGEYAKELNIKLERIKFSSSDIEKLYIEGKYDEIVEHTTTEIALIHQVYSLLRKLSSERLRNYISKRYKFHIWF